MKLSREGEEGGASRLDERGDGPAEQSFTDVGDEPFIAAPVLEIERGAVLAGRYQIETTIGKGGSGVVLRAFDRIAQAPVAVKILKPELAADPRWVERFSRELRLARQIQHANVCRVFDIGEADGHRFLTMELASEGTLRTGARGDAPPRSMQERIADARALVAGMAAIHAAGIVHRDVKPENLLRMEDGRLVVSDFGLATNPAQTATVTLMVGTPSYMAPEMSMGDPASFRSDVWAIGVVMHEILFARRPEWEVTARERIFRSPVDQDAPATVRALAQLCGDCAAETPSSRPADAVEVARRFVAAEQASAAPPARRLPIRRRWAIAAAVAVLALGAGVARRHWRPAAVAVAGSDRSLKLAGSALDVGAARRVATFEGRVRCFSMLPGGRSFRVVVGEPQRAFDVDTETGALSASPLRPETYLYGCPVLSSDGRELLYETVDDTGAHQILYSHSPDGEDGRILTRGTNPEWIPNTDDFVMDLDLTHAAVFSIPVMNSSVVPDDSNGQRRLSGKAVSSHGNLLALRYLDTRGESLFVIHSLPDLDTRASFALPGSARNQRFDRRTDDLEVSIDGAKGNAVLAMVDWRAGMARYHAELPDWDLRGELPDGHGTTLFLTRRLVDDVWQYDGPTATPRRLTADGNNDNAALSPAGRLLIQSRRRPDGYVIMLFEPGSEAPGLITPGPHDVTPVFSEHGDDWFYVRQDRQAIVHCDARNSCTDIHADPQGPLWPVPAPDSQRVAYLTWLNTPRLKLLSLSDGTVRDLGAAIADCAPFWSDNQHVWVLQSSERRPEWIEIDLRTGRRSGRRQEAGTETADHRDCAMKTNPLQARYPQVRVVSSESSQIRASRMPERL
jgi:serine/threonine protein kinase